MAASSAIDLPFWHVPERLFDEPDELVVWARAALAGRIRLPRRENGDFLQMIPRKLFDSVS